jgi:suppressor of ftsI
MLGRARLGIVATAALAAALITCADGASPLGLAARATAASDCHSSVAPVIHDGFPEPPALYSRDGRLEVTLQAQQRIVRFDHRRVRAMAYDGSIPGPTLVICSGDHLTVHLQNELHEATNLHTHGFHVSPEGNSDNIFLSIAPGQAFTYEYNIPADMEPGSYWYHPHLHPTVESQIFQGLAGAIVEEGGLDRLPALRRVPQRWIVLQSTDVAGRRILTPEQSTEAGNRIYVNGVLDPTARIAPGQLQRWRIFNASADRFIVLRLPARQRFTLLAQDGHTLERAQTVSELMIAPGSRRDVLVRGPAPGRFPVRAVPFAQFPGATKTSTGGPPPDQAVLTLRSQGPRVRMAAPRGRLSDPFDLRSMTVDRQRTIVFGEMEELSGKLNYTLDGMTFDPNRIDVTMKLGSLERWTLQNTTGEWHTFHIHTNDFQVVSAAGRAIPYVDYQDNVALAPHSSTVILIHPTDFTGKFVFHCHVTYHEDMGMMATVQVVREPTAGQARSTVVHDGGFGIASSALGSRDVPAVGPLVFFCGHGKALRGLGHAL